MPPIPCAHCGNNFMQPIPNSEMKLCNCCITKEKIRKPTKDAYMNHVEILIKCPADQQIKIEEYCICNGLDFSKYFMSLHDLFSPINDVSQNDVSQNDYVTEKPKKGGKK